MPVRRRLVPFLLLLSPVALAAQQAPRGITAEDYYAFTSLADPQLSPDGTRVLYVASRVDRAANRRVPSAWVVPVDGRGAPQVVVGEGWTPSAARWSPDGRSIAFLSSKADSASARPAGPARPQLWIAPADASAPPRRVTSAVNGVSRCSWAPDGRRFACLVRSGPSDSLNTGPERSDVRHYAHANYKFNDTGWFDDKRTHVAIVDAASGAVTPLTSGDDWNDADPRWSPDGRMIAFVSNRTGHEFDFDANTDIWTIPAAGGALTRISTGAGRDASPAWSPDGKTLAWLSSPDEDDPPQILVAPSTGGMARPAARGLDLIPGNLQWGADGRALWFETGVKGELHLFRVDLASGAVTQVTHGARGVRAMDVGAKALVYLVNDFEHLDDVYAANLDGRGERKLTDVNGALWKGLATAKVERIPFKGADGWDVDGFLVKPLGWTPGTKAPMILSIHGGPAGQYGVDWYHEFQVYAARGYAVFFTNPRGSTGYGRAFQRGIAGEWGGKDYEDVMRGVDAVLAANPWIDTTRLGVTGGSYGGYLTNWIVGHTNRFKAAVTLRSVVNFISDEGTRDGAYGHARDFGGDLFERFDLYWDRSPLKYAKQVQTPILVLHSDNDYRVPLEQGEQWFRALRHYGKTAEMVIFPRENHNLTRTGEPRHLVESLRWQLYWFARYLDGDAAAVPPDRR